MTSRVRTLASGLVAVVVLALSGSAVLASTPARVSEDAARGVVDAALAASRAPVRAVVLFAPAEPEASIAAGVVAAPGRAAWLAERRTALARAAEAAGVEVVHRYARVGALAVRGDGASLLRLAAAAGVERIVADPSGGAHMNQVRRLSGFNVLWRRGLDGAATTVAVVDSGVDRFHPDLFDSVVGERCWCSRGNGCCPNGQSRQTGTGAARDDHGHGTHIAGLITANGDDAPRGGAPAADVLALRVLDADGLFCCLSDVVAALDWLADQEPAVDVVNLSLGTSSTYEDECDDEAPLRSLREAVEALVEEGTTVIASAGNAADRDGMSAPACLSDVVSVGAVWDANVGPVALRACTETSTRADQVACYSNVSESTDLLAPGGFTTSTRRGGGREEQVGTSHAAAATSACAAVLRGARPRDGDGEPLVGEELEERIASALRTSSIRLAVPGREELYPRLDCVDAAASLLGTPTSTTTTLPAPICGDADGDGQVVASDALRILASAVGVGSCPLARCDLDGDGRVAAVDALLDLRVVVGLPAVLGCPVEED